MGGGASHKSSVTGIPSRQLFATFPMSESVAVRRLAKQDRVYKGNSYMLDISDPPPPKKNWTVAVRVFLDRHRVHHKWEGTAGASVKSPQTSNNLNVREYF